MSSAEGPAAPSIFCTVERINLYKYPSANVSVNEEARGVWGYAPPEKVFEFDAVRWLLRLFFGPK